MGSYGISGYHKLSLLGSAATQQQHMEPSHDFRGLLVGNAKSRDSSSSTSSRCLRADRQRMRAGHKCPGFPSPAAAPTERLRLCSAGASGRATHQPSERSCSSIMPSSSWRVGRRLWSREGKGGRVRFRARCGVSAAHIVSNRDRSVALVPRGRQALCCARGRRIRVQPGVEAGEGALRPAPWGANGLRRHWEHCPRLGGQLARGGQ